MSRKNQITVLRYLLAADIKFMVVSHPDDDRRRARAARRRGARAAADA